MAWLHLHCNICSIEGLGLDPMGLAFVSLVGVQIAEPIQLIFSPAPQSDKGFKDFRLAKFKFTRFDTFLSS